jgi:hypothetical protein
MIGEHPDAGDRPAKEWRPAEKFLQGRPQLLAHERR